MAYDENTAERVRQLLKSRRHVVEKMLMGGLCFMVNGNMCVNASRHGGLMLRVGPDAFQALAKEPHARAIEMRGGRTMTGFVYVEPPGFAGDADLKTWVGRALEFVTTLRSSAAQAKGKPKPHGKTTPAKKAAPRKRS